MRRLFPMLILLFCSQLLSPTSITTTQATDDDYCVTIYYAPDESEYWEDTTITRIETVSPPDYEITAEDGTWIDANLTAADPFHSPAMVTLTDPTVERYSVILSEIYQGSESFGLVHLYDKETHLTSLLINSVGGAAEWSGDGRLFLAWHPDENGDIIADDEDLRMAIYEPEQGITAETRFQVDGFDRLQSRGWSADRSTIALLNNGVPYVYWSNEQFFDSSRILLIDPTTLQPITELVNISAFRWSPTGNMFAYITRNELVIGQPDDVSQMRFELIADDVQYVLPEWSAKGDYVVAKQIPYYENIVYTIVDPSTKVAITLEAETPKFSPIGGEFNHWSDDDQRWLYLQNSEDGTLTIMAYHAATHETKPIVKQIAYRIPPLAGGAFQDAFTFYGDKIYYVAETVDELTIHMIQDDGSHDKILAVVPANEKLMGLRLSPDGEYIIVITGETLDDDASWGYGPYNQVNYITVHWFNAAGEAVGSVTRGYIDIAEIESDPVPAMLLQTRTGLEFEALYIKLDEPDAISVLNLDEHEGAPYGYWDANWWMETSPTGEYTWLRFEQPYPIWYEGQFLVAPYGASVGEAVNYGTWSPDGNLLLTSEYIIEEGENYYDSTLTNTILRITTPDGDILWEYDVPVEHGLYTYFWSTCKN